MGHWNLTQTLGISNDDGIPPIGCGAQWASGSSTFSPTTNGDTTYTQLDEDDSPVLQATCSTGLTQRRPGPVGQFQVRRVKPIMPFLAMLYLRAQRIHHLARNVHVFHMQSIYLARQALHLVILLNDTVNVDEGPGDEQYDERNDLEDELIELYEAMTQWGSNRGEVFEYHQLTGEIQAQYAQFFKERFYFHDARDCSMDRVYQKFVAYDEKTIRYRQRHQIHVTSSTTVEIDCWTETLEEGSENEAEAEWPVEDAVGQSPPSAAQSAMMPQALAADVLPEDLHFTPHRTSSGRAPKSHLHPRNDHTWRKNRAIAAIRIHLAVTHLQVVQIGARKHVKLRKSRWKCDKRCVKTPPATTEEQEAIPEMSVPLLGHSTLNDPSPLDPLPLTTETLRQFHIIPLLESQDQIGTLVDTNSPQSQQGDHLQFDLQFDLPDGEWQLSPIERNPILPIRSTEAPGAGAACSPTYTTGFISPMSDPSWTRDWALHSLDPHSWLNSRSIPEQYPTNQTQPITFSPDPYPTPANVPQNRGTPFLALYNEFLHRVTLLCSWQPLYIPLSSRCSIPSPLTIGHTEENKRRIDALSPAERELVTTDGGTIELQLMVLHAIEQYLPDTENNRVWDMVHMTGSEKQTEYCCKAFNHHGLKCCHKSATVVEARQHFVACHVKKLCWVCPFEGCRTKWLQLHDLKRHLASLPNVDQPYSRVVRTVSTRSDLLLPATTDPPAWSKAGHTSRRGRRSLAEREHPPWVGSSMKMHWDKEPEEYTGHSTNEQEGHRQHAPMAEEVLSWTSSDPRSSVLFNSNVGINYHFVTESDNRNITTTTPWRAARQAWEGELPEWNCDASFGSAKRHDPDGNTPWSERGFPLFEPILDVPAHSASQLRNDADASGFNRTTPHTGSTRYLAPELYPINTLSVQSPSATDTGSNDLAMGHRNWIFQYLNEEPSTRLAHARDHIQDHHPLGVRVEWSPDGNNMAGYNDDLLACERDGDVSPHGIVANTWHRKLFSCGRRYQPYPTRTQRTRPQRAPLSFLCSP